MQTLSSYNRDLEISETENQMFDLIVIGGGITGAGIALDAAARGMHVCLVEKYDFASGTSSKSTKLIHGGLRYLKQMEFALVQEVGMERAVLHKLAPHLVKPVSMLLPIYKNGSLGRFTTAIALGVYDWLARVKKEERYKMLKTKDVLQLEPLIAKINLVGGALYKEYQTDDARLTMSVLKSAVQYGAKCFNYCKVEKLLYSNNQICGVEVNDLIHNTSFQIKAHIVVNATGPWVDEIRSADDTLNKKFLHLTKGIHIVIGAENFPVHQAIYFDVMQDKRMIFAIPRETTVYIGTTDTTYKGEIDQPLATENDVQYLLDAINAKFPSVNLNKAHVLSGWAGLRPLIHKEGKSPNELSRKDEVFVSAHNLISIAGGKLTGYRKMAQKVVDLVAEKLIKISGAVFSMSATHQLPLSGSDFNLSILEYIERRAGEAKQAGFTKSEIAILVFKYGTAVEVIIENAFELYHSYTDVQERKIAAEIKYAVEHEMVLHVSDFLIRRTGLIYFNVHYTKAIYKKAAYILGGFLHLSKAEIETQIQFFEQAFHDATKFA